MSVNTYSAFTYGHTITDENKYIQFNEGSGEITVEIPIGSYTLGSFVNAIGTAMNSGNGVTGEYTASVDRSQRVISISSTVAFSLPVLSGSLAGQSAFELMGFSFDKSSATSQTGDTVSGEYFSPQYLLQTYTPFVNNVRTIQATVNQSASGQVEVVSYGRVNFMECNITLQTDIVQGNGSLLRSDPQGETNLRAFLDYATTKAPIEFIEDVDSPDNFTDCLLESTQESGSGVD